MAACVGLSRNCFRNHLCAKDMERNPKMWITQMRWMDEESSTLLLSTSLALRSLLPFLDVLTLPTALLHCLCPYASPPTWWILPGSLCLSPSQLLIWASQRKSTSWPELWILSPDTPPFSYLSSNSGLWLSLNTLPWLLFLQLLFEVW